MVKRIAVGIVVALLQFGSIDVDRLHARITTVDERSPSAAVEVRVRGSIDVRELLKAVISETPLSNLSLNWMTRTMMLSERGSLRQASMIMMIHVAELLPELHDGSADVDRDGHERVIARAELVEACSGETEAASAGESEALHSVVLTSLGIVVSFCVLYVDEMSDGRAPSSDGARRHSVFRFRYARNSVDFISFMPRASMSLRNWAAMAGKSTTLGDSRNWAHEIGEEHHLLDMLVADFVGDLLDGRFHQCDDAHPPTPIRSASCSAYKMLPGPVCNCVDGSFGSMTSAISRRSVRARHWPPFRDVVGDAHLRSFPPRDRGFDFRMHAVAPRAYAAVRRPDRVREPALRRFKWHEIVVHGVLVRGIARTPDAGLHIVGPDPV